MIRHGGTWAGPLVALAALAPAMLPLAFDGVPATHDGHLHIQRAMALERLWAGGIPFSRWLPDFAYGYGMPLFNYYAPLVYAPMLALRLLGASFADSYKLTAALALAGSALSMYACGRAMMGPAGATAAALVYASLPYQLVNVYVRGALAESAALAIAPLGVLALLRTHAAPGVGGALAIAGATAALALAHNVSALIALPALTLLAIFLWRGSPSPTRFVAAALLGTMGGLGIAAWFWAPALLERDAVTISALIEPKLFASFFLRDWPPFQLTLGFDYQAPTSDALGAPIYWPRLGLVQLVLTAAAIPLAIRRHGSGQRTVRWAVAMVALGWALQFRPAAPLFDALPLVGFIQFPWRLLALVGLGSALLVGSAVDRLGRPRWRAVAIMAVGGLSIWAAIARLAPLYEYPEDRFLTAAAQTRLELANFGLGSTHGGEYLPTSVGRPHSTRLWKDLAAFEGDESNIGPDQAERLRVVALRRTPLSLDLEVDADQPVRLHLHQFWFPGWAGWIDDRPSTLEPSGRLGIVAIDVPAGRHRVTFAFEWTHLRLAASTVSLVAALALAAASTKVWLGQPSLPARRARAAAALTVGLLAAGCLGVASRGGGAEDRLRPVTPAPVRPGLILLDATLDERAMADRRVLLVDAEWLTGRARMAPLAVDAIVEAADGSRQVARWPLEPLVPGLERFEVVRSEIDVRLPTEFPAGDARVGLAVPGSAVSLEPLWIGQVRVPPGRADSSRQFAVVANQRLGPDANLLTFETRPTARDGRAAGRGNDGAARAGDVVDVSLEIGVERPPGRDLLAVVELRGPGARARSEPHTLGGWYAPPAAWQAGDRVRQRIRMQLPPDLLAGRYEVHLLTYAAPRGWVGLAPFSSFAPSPKGPPISDLDLGRLEVEP